MLKLENLHVSLGTREVLHGVSLTADIGMTGILGPNGSGKTTLLRCIMGAIPPTAGDIFWNGVSLAEKSIRKRAQIISYMEQQPNAPSGMTAMDFIGMSYYPKNGMFYRLGEKEQNAITALARDFSAEPCLSEPMEALSVGEKQIISLIAAAVQDTPILLLDEPTAALDYRNTHRLFSLLKRWKSEKTMLAVLHDPSFALRYCDRILLFSDGTVLDVLEPSSDTPERMEKILHFLYPDLHLLKNGDVFLCY